MKKFLVILMVVAMASFLFVGCLPSVTPDVDDDEDEDVVVPTSATPVMTAVETSAEVLIFSATATGTLYMNKDEAGTSILVKGTARSESSVQIYLDDVAIAGAVGETAKTGLWSVAVAESSLGADGAGKVLHATATEVGLAESAASNSVTFTLDTVKPSATTLAATADDTTPIAFTSTITAGVAMVDSFVTVGATGTLAAGTWTVSSVAASGTALNVCVSDGTNPIYYTVTDGLTVLTDVIPGIRIRLNQDATTAYTSSGNITTLTITAATAIAERARVLFSEEITSASAILPANYVFLDGAAATIGTPLSYAAKYMYFSPFTTVLAQGEVLTVTVNGVIDKAGNIQTTASVLTCTVGAAHATSLAP